MSTELTASRMVRIRLRTGMTTAASTGNASPESSTGLNTGSRYAPMALRCSCKCLFHFDLYFPGFWDPHNRTFSLPTYADRFQRCCNRNSLTRTSPEVCDTRRRRSYRAGVFVVGSEGSDGFLEGRGAEHSNGPKSKSSSHAAKLVVS